MASMVALNGISRHCLAQMHLAQPSVRVKNLPESNHSQENGGEKQDFFQLLAHARALGHGVTSSIWQIIA